MSAIAASMSRPESGVIRSAPAGTEPIGTRPVRPDGGDALTWPGRVWHEPENTEFTLRRWSRDHPRLSSCHTTSDVLEAIRRDPDEVLAFLIAHAQNGCAVAAHLIARTMAPKLRRMAAVDRQAGFDDYLAHLWLRVHDYPLGRRRIKIAANLALDTLKAVIAERLPDREALVVPDSLERVHDERAGSGALAREVIRTAMDLRLIDAVTADILMSVYCDGLTGREAAARHGTSPEMVRYRCSRYVRRMAAHRSTLVMHLHSASWGAETAWVA